MVHIVGRREVVSSRLGIGIQRLENCLCQPSSKWVPLSELGKDKAAKGEGWSSHFLSCAQDSGTLTPTAPTAIIIQKRFSGSKGKIKETRIADSSYIESVHGP